MPVAKDPNALRNSACVTLIEKLKESAESPKDDKKQAIRYHVLCLFLLIRRSVVPPGV